MKEPCLGEEPLVLDLEPRAGGEVAAELAALGSVVVGGLEGSSGVGVELLLGT
jgi:hypothetical protein